MAKTESLHPFWKPFGPKISLHRRPLVHRSSRCVTQSRGCRPRWRTCRTHRGSQSHADVWSDLHESQSFTGAELEGIVKGAASFAVARALTQAEGQGFLDLGRAPTESSGGGGGVSTSGMRVRD
jgi:hypothetical protein